MTNLALELIAREKKDKTGKLDLGKCGLNRLPDALFELDWLKELIVSNSWFDWEQKQFIESVNNGPNNSLEENLPDNFKKLKHLKKLYLSRIYDKGAQHRTNNWEGFDVSVLAHLPDLQSLDLSSNNIIDYSFLENLTSLQSLNVGYNEFVPIRFLKNLTSLQSLNLSSNEITNISSLEKLTSLQNLNLTRNKIKDISPLERLTNLKFLKLTDNQFIGSHILEKFTNLQTLELSITHISDYSFLEKLTGLQTLGIGGNYISDIRFLENLTSLQSLSLHQNEIRDISVLEKLTGLQDLALHGNQISGLFVIENLINLQSLNLNRNKITDIRFSENLTNLQSLDLSFNQIKDIRFLEKLPGLQTLDLRYNQISDIRFSKNLTNLQSLDLSNNQISDISPLKDLIKSQRFETLFLYANPFVKENDLELTYAENNIQIIQSFLSRQEEAEKEPFKLPTKVLILGNHASGKSSLLYYLKNKNLGYKGNSTHLISIEKYYIAGESEDKLSDAIFYDFGGQDYYHGVYRMFLSTEAIFLFVWNVFSNNNEKKPDTDGLPIYNFNLSYWLGQKLYFERQKAQLIDSNLEQQKEKSDPILLIQTHADDKESDRKIYPNPYNECEITNEFYISLLNSNTLYANASALTYLTNTIDGLIIHIQQKQSGRKEPKWYKEFIQFILEQQESGDHIPINVKEILLPIYQPKNTDEGDRLKNLKIELDQLHKKGLILYYRERIPDFA